jgi:hypothetical protein
MKEAYHMIQGYPLIRSLLVSTLLLTILFAGAIVVIRAHPYDDDDLRSFLMAENCVAPCWQGIQPGRMTVQKALVVLRKHAWIRHVDTNLYDGFRGWIRWEWSGLEPDWIIPSEKDNVWIDQNLVVNVSLVTNVRFGDIWLALGAPDWTNIYYARGDGTMRVLNGYQRATVVVTLNVGCDANMNQLWFASASILWPIYLPERGEIAHGSPKMLSTCE